MTVADLIAQLEAEPWTPERAVNLVRLRQLPQDAHVFSGDEPSRPDTIVVTLARGADGKLRVEGKAP